MNRKELSAEINLSSQSNLVNDDRTHLSQFNFIVILGKEYLNRVDENQAKINLSIHIDKSGEITIGGLDEDVLNNKEKVQIFSDRKISIK